MGCGLAARWLRPDDRWHVPSDESTVRQRRLRGAPVVETSLRVPGGDAVHTVYAAADHGGLTVVNVENRSSLPLAVAFSRRDLLTTRPPTDGPVHGIDLPPASIVLPVGHGASIRIALAHDGRPAGVLPTDLPAAEQVARGWVAQVDRSPRLVVPDEVLSDGVIAARADLLLAGPPDPDIDPAGFLLGVGELVTLGDDPKPWIDPVASVVVPFARVRRARQPAWDDGRALAAAADVLRRAGERRGADDVEELAQRLGPCAPRPLVAPPGVRLVPWVVSGLVAPALGGADLLPAEVDPAWFGRGIEVYDAAVPMGRVSFAVRWHGPRPALLWECSAPMRLRCPGLDAAWSTDDPRGEALLLAPAPPT